MMYPREGMNMSENRPPVSLRTCGAIREDSDVNSYVALQDTREGSLFLSGRGTKMLVAVRPVVSACENDGLTHVLVTSVVPSKY